MPKKPSRPKSAKLAEELHDVGMDAARPLAYWTIATWATTTKPTRAAMMAIAKHVLANFTRKKIPEPRRIVRGDKRRTR